MTLKKIRKIILIISLILLSGGGGYWLGQREISFSWQNFNPQTSVVNRATPPGTPIDFSLFWAVWDRVSRDFIEKEKIDPQKMVWGAISGMVQSLEDPYTVFLPPQENKEAKDELGGKFEGIGAQLGMKEKRIVVIAPLAGMPAKKAGILSGDVILKVNDEDTTGWTLPQAVSKIRGQKGTKVVLTVLHRGGNSEDEVGETEDIEIVRGTIKVPSVEVEILNEPCNLAHLQLARFGDQTSNEWDVAITEILNSKSKISNFKGIILDLRNNPGGYLQGSVFVASEFLKDGTIVIQEDAKGKREIFSVNRTGKLTETPLVILINQGSASASEIVAGALQERRKIKVVGEKSFGKGSIQEAQDLPQGAGLHITTSKWLLPSGTWINGEGIEADVKIEEDLETETDEQLEKAKEVLCQ
ncbi:S41 family peptidase [Candidatus Microgenomates bacterium]|nr:S41 family peptidase [Candidatus Microgenomates bacterium]